MAPAEGFSFVGPVTGELVVENTGSLLLVRGRLRATVRIACVRCLAERDQVMDIDVFEEFASETTEPTVETVDRDEPEAAAIADYVLDVYELMRQQVTVNLPMAFVCRSDCRGICPTCGRNLSEGPCGCDAEAIDDRWGKLKGLLAGNASEAES
jgi:uncharacterized protein